MLIMLKKECIRSNQIFSFGAKGNIIWSRPKALRVGLGVKGGSEMEMKKI